MFNRKNENFYGQGFYQDNQLQRLFYQFEETNRKLRNLNNRLRRLENYLGLRNEDKYDEDMYENL